MGCTSEMSQQAAAGPGPGRGVPGRSTRRRPRFYTPRGREAKGFKLAISKIASNTFNMGQNKFAAQFMQLHKNAVNYLQRTSGYKGYLVAKTVRTGREQIISLPPAVDPNAADAADLNIIRAEEVKTVAK